MRYLRDAQSDPQHCLLSYLPHGGGSWASWAGVPAGGETALDVTTNSVSHPSQACGASTNTLLTCRLCLLEVCLRLAGRQMEENNSSKTFQKPKFKTLNIARFKRIFVIGNVTHLCNCWPNVQSAGSSPLFKSTWQVIVPSHIYIYYKLTASP